MRKNNSDRALYLAHQLKAAIVIMSLEPQWARNSVEHLSL